MSSINSSVLVVILGAFLLLSAVAVGCGSEPPPYPDAAMNVAMVTIEGRSEVVDSSLSQNDEGDLILVLVVQFGTSEVVAKGLMEDFARLAKILGPEDPPSIEEIGRGLYDYRVGIFYPNEELIDRGAKVRESPKITW